MLRVRDDHPRLPSRRRSTGALRARHSCPPRPSQSAIRKFARRLVNELLLPLALTLGVPLLVSGVVAFTRPRSGLDWFVSAFLCGGVSVYMYLAGPWAWIGFDWRTLPLAVAGGAMLWSACG